MMRARLLPAARAALATLLLVAVPALHAGKPTSQPLPQLETGMHVGAIYRIAADDGWRWAATVSDDKTARVWDLASGRLIRVLRPPQDLGNEGKLFAVAMSPDGDLVAVSGWTGYDWDGESSVYVFERESGRMRSRFSVGRTMATEAMFSPDGRHLAVATESLGVRLYDIETGRGTGAGVYSGESYSVHFSPDGRRLVTGSFGGYLRLYAVERGELRPVLERPSSGKEPFNVRFSPDGRSIAVSFNDVNVVQVLDAETLQETARPSVEGVGRGKLTSLAWSRNGRGLMGAGDAAPDRNYVVRRWTVGEWSRYSDTPVSRDTVMGLAALADGRVLFVARDPAWGILSAGGRFERAVRSDTPDFRNQPLRLSYDGRRVLFGYEGLASESGVFDIAQRSLSTPGSTAGLEAPRSNAPGLDIVWDFTEKPTLNGRVLTLDRGERSHAAAIAPNGERFALGSDWTLRLYDRAGVQRWERKTPGSTWTVNISGNGQWAVAAYADGTIRWHRLSDGKETLALFLHADRKRWVAWTPEGFFDASPDAEELIGYHLNRSQDQEGDFVSAQQYRDRFYQPGLVASRLDSGGNRLLAEALNRIGDVRELLNGRNSRTPLIEVLTPRHLTGEDEVTVTVRVRDQGGGIGRVVFYVDGQPMEGRQAGTAVEGAISRSFPLLPGGLRGIAVAATNPAGVEGPRELMYGFVTGTRKEAALHVLAVGIDTYRDTRLKLQYSARDAERMAAQLAAGGKGLFKRGVLPPVVLKNEQATLAGIEQAFVRMVPAMQAQDTVVIFLAGHGEAPIGTNYRFLPWEFQRGASGNAGQGLNEERLGKLLAKSPSQTLLLLDTCDAGGAVEMIEAAYQRLNGISKHVVIGASRRGEFAMEGYKEHGVFTAAFLSILQSKPAGEHDRILHLTEIRGRLRGEVERIRVEMKGNYRQQISGFLGSADFPLVMR